MAFSDWIISVCWLCKNFICKLGYVKLGQRWMIHLRQAQVTFIYPCVAYKMSFLSHRYVNDWYFVSVCAKPTNYAVVWLDINTKLRYTIVDVNRTTTVHFLFIFIFACSPCVPLRKVGDAESIVAATLGVAIWQLLCLEWFLRNVYVCNKFSVQVMNIYQLIFLMMMWFYVTRSPFFTGLGRCPIVNWDFCWSSEHFWTGCPSCRPPMTFTGITN